jgi:hypothetical protein
MFTSYGIKEKTAEVMSKDIISQTEYIMKMNFEKIKQKYPLITTEDAKIISSYTCETLDTKYSPYKLLNKNLVDENREEGIKRISKYFYIFFKSLKKLSRYYPNSKSDHVYRCINKQVNYQKSIYNQKLLLYNKGRLKTFWGFTSVSTKINLSYKYLYGTKSINEGTIFDLYGDFWGYDITLFNEF